MYFDNKEAFFAAPHVEVQGKVKEFVEEYDTLFLDSREWVEHFEIDYIGETIDITTTVSSGCGCCSDDTEYLYLPLSYMWNDDWKGDRQQEIDNEAAAAKVRAEKRREEEAIKAKERRRKQYLELKEEFEV